MEWTTNSIQVVYGVFQAIEVFDEWFDDATGRFETVGWELVSLYESRTNAERVANNLLEKGYKVKVSEVELI